MRIGMCMSLRTTHVAQEHAALLRNIKAVGFDGGEVPIFEGEPDHYARLGDLLNEIGLERTAVAAMGDPAVNLIGDRAPRARKAHGRSLRSGGLVIMRDCAG